ncbi:unnamed protein product [Gadus morhua 'NCC']|uniref:Cell division cycle 20B n=1 Tax=Gadus morhua TaxID=8049 RepID=A0A8C5BLV3_GADMO
MGILPSTTLYSDFWVGTKDLLKSPFSCWDGKKKINLRMLLGEFVEKRKHCPLELSAQKINNPPSNHACYKRFRRRICRGHGSDGAPLASTPLATGRCCSPCYEFDTVRQRLAMDSPPRDSTTETTQDVTNKSLQGAEVEVEADLKSRTDKPPIPPPVFSIRSRPETSNATRKGWLWAVAEEGNTNTDGWNQNGGTPLQPFAVLSRESLEPQSKAAMKLAAPSLLNDYYSNLLASSCTGLIALALGSDVYLWNSETQSLEGHVHPAQGPAPHSLPGRAGRPRQPVSSLCWSADGRLLSIGTRQGLIKLWDVETKITLGCLRPHLSGVGALSWKQNLLSSGSVLGRIHHHDPRVPTALVGAADQQGGVCSLQWSPGEDRLASGSKDGRLSVWDGDVAAAAASQTAKPLRPPLVTMKQPSAVKAMGWCPWQRHVIATGGGWRDGELRIWDTQSASCVNSYATNSQICSLLWAEEKRSLVCGHGLPHHNISCWAADNPTSLNRSHQLKGHTDRVLHLAMSPASASRLFSAGADERVHVWSL